MDHTIVHFEIPAENVERLRKFYAGVFGWKTEKAPGPVEYWLIETVPVDEKMNPIRPGVNGGLYKKEDPKLKTVNYYSVENIDQFIEKIQTTGGKIIQPKQEVPNVGWVAIATDPKETNSLYCSRHRRDREPFLISNPECPSFLTKPSFRGCSQILAGFLHVGSNLPKLKSRIT